MLYHAHARKGKRGKNCPKLDVQRVITYICTDHLIVLYTRSSLYLSAHLLHCTSVFITFPNWKCVFQAHFVGEHGTELYLE